MLFSESQRGDEQLDEQPQSLHLLKRWFSVSPPKLFQQLATNNDDKALADSLRQPPERKPSSLNNINQLHLKMIES